MIENEQASFTEMMLAHQNKPVKYSQGSNSRLASSRDTSQQRRQLLKHDSMTVKMSREVLQMSHQQTFEVEEEGY